MRVCFYTLGCKVNLNETGALEQLFRAHGFTIAQEGEAADVFIVNSCTVTNFGDQKSRKWLRRKKRENPGAVTVLTGCYPQAFPEEAAAIGIIGGADGPTAIQVTKTLAPALLGAIAIAAYSYMALIPMIQPPFMRLLTTKKERVIKMKELRPVS